MSEITHSCGKCTVSINNKDLLTKFLLLMNLRYHDNEYNIKIVELSKKGYYNNLPIYPVIDEFVRKHFNIEDHNIKFDIEGQARYTFDDNIKLVLPEILEYDYEHEQLNQYRDELVKTNITIHFDIEEVRIVDGLSWQTEYTVSAHNKNYTYEILENNNMANYSEAKGTIVVRAKTKEILEKFIYLHVLVNKELLTYTKFDIFEDLYAANNIKFEDVIQKLDIHKNTELDLFEVVLDFKGTGRYNYTNTIQDMFLELFDEELYDVNPLCTSLIKSLRDELKDEYFELLFDITDFEDGYGILYQGEYALIRRDQEVIYEICAEYDYDCTDENIEKFGFKGI